MQLKRLTEKQKLKHEILNVKKLAKKESHSSAYTQVQIATEHLQELYSSSHFRENTSFLLWRYTKLEKKDRIWTLLCIPAFISILGIVFSKENLVYFFQELKADINTLINIFETASSLGLLVQLIYYGCIGIILLFIVLFVYYLIVIIKLIFNSLTRNPNTTIIENELCILRVLLEHHKILLDEKKEADRIDQIYKSEVIRY